MVSKKSSIFSLPRKKNNKASYYINFSCFIFRKRTAFQNLVVSQKADWTQFENRAVLRYYTFYYNFYTILL